MLSGHGRNGGRRAAGLVCLLALGTAAALLGACERKKEGGAAGKQAAQPLPAVVVAEVIQKTVPIYAEFVATTVALQTIELRARVEGILEQVLFKEGSEVRKGQALFVIERARYEAAVEGAKAQIARARADVQIRKASLAKQRQDVARLKPLAQQRAVPQQDLDGALAREQEAAAAVEAAEAAVQAAQAALPDAELNLSYTTIRAPVNGIIGLLKVDKGNLVGKGESTLLATMSTIDPIKVEFSGSELDYLRLTKRHSTSPSADRQGGQRQPAPLELILADDSIYPYKGRVLAVERALDLKTGTLTVQGEFPNPGKVLRAGQFARVRVALEQREGAILVPQRAVQEIQGAKSVLVVGADDVVALRTITPAESVGDYLIVRDGVKPGERVIVDGIQKARPGTKVAPTAAAGGVPGAKPAERAPEQKAEGEPSGKAGGK